MVLIFSNLQSACSAKGRKFQYIEIELQNFWILNIFKIYKMSKNPLFQNFWKILWLTFSFFVKSIILKLHSFSNFINCITNYYIIAKLNFNNYIIVYDLPAVVRRIMIMFSARCQNQTRPSRFSLVLSRAWGPTMIHVGFDNRDFWIL